MNQQSYPVNVDDYVRDTDHRSGFVTGQQPQWLTASSTGGGSVTFETDSGGQASLQTGTESTGDGASVRLGVAGDDPTTIRPADYDVVALTVVGGGNVTGARNHTGFVGPDARLVHRREDNVVETAGENQPVPRKYWEGIDRYNWPPDTARTALVWDVAGETAWCLVGGLSSPPLTGAALPDPTADYEVVFQSLETTDAADRSASLRSVAFEAFVER